MIDFKDGVTSTLPLVTILLAASAAYAAHQVPAVVTSLADGVHKTGSRHYHDLAADLRTWHLPDQPNPCLTHHEMGAALLDVIGALQKALGPAYQIVFETDLYNQAGQRVRWQHLHIEYDPPQ
jgi:hypothetical protein